MMRGRPLGRMRHFARRHRVLLACAAAYVVASQYSIFLQAMLAWPFIAELDGIPATCGMNARATDAWMNPADFNASRLARGGGGGARGGRARARAAPRRAALRRGLRALGHDRAHLHARQAPGRVRRRARARARPRASASARPRAAETATGASLRERASLTPVPPAPKTGARRSLRPRGPNRARARAGTRTSRTRAWSSRSSPTRSARSSRSCPCSRAATTRARGSRAPSARRAGRSSRRRTCAGSAASSRRCRPRASSCSCATGATSCSRCASASARASPAGPHVLGRWVNDNTAGLRYERDPRMLVVRLEDLARPPYATLRRVLRHYGLAFDDALIHQMVSGSGHGEARRASRARARPPPRARCSPRGGSGGRVDSARAESQVNGSSMLSVPKAKNAAADHTKMRMSQARVSRRAARSLVRAPCADCRSRGHSGLQAAAARASALARRHVGEAEAHVQGQRVPV